MNNETNSASVLDKFAEKIDFTKLVGEPEAFYKAGLAFVENGQFDDGIIEFIKVIKTVSHQESLFVDTVKELKSMGFSSADIRAAVGIPEIEGEKEIGVDSQSLTTSIPFWENPKAKLRGLLILYALEFIFTLPWSIFAVLNPSILIMFPVGLAQVLAPHDFRNQSLYGGLGWLLYIGISTTIMISNNKNIIRVLFIVLSILLLVNAAGCHALGPEELNG